MTNIAVISAIKPNGASYDFTPPNAPTTKLYPFLVYFEDNTHGSVNSKSETPPYRVGESVGYEVTGNFKGVSKLKITRNPQQQGQPAKWTPPAPVTKPFPKLPQTDADFDAAYVESIKPVFGATVGMAMNQAIEILTSSLTHDERVERISNPVFWGSVHEVASDVIRVARELEEGRLAPSPKERTNRLLGASKGQGGASPRDDETLDPPF